MGSLLLEHQTALCSLFWHMPHHVKSCCKESLGNNPFDALNTVDRQLTSLTALFRDIYILLRGLAPWLLCSTFKSENDILSNLPVRVIAVVMNALWLSLAQKHYFRSSDNVAMYCKSEIFRLECHVLYMLRHPPTLPFNSSCILLPVWALQNESFLHWKDRWVWDIGAHLNRRIKSRREEKYQT